MLIATSAHSKRVVGEHCLLSIAHGD